MSAVVWVRSTLVDLSRILAGLTATEHAAVQAALQEIGTRLRNDPENEGESRPGDRRITFVGPLGLTFEIHSEEGMVVVLSVWWIAKRRPDVG